MSHSEEKTQMRITVTRVELMRLLAGQIRKKTQLFEKAKKKYPRELSNYQKKLIKESRELLWKLEDASTYDQVFKAAHANGDYKLLAGIPSPPSLNLCEENALLQQLKLEKRDKLSLRATDKIWTLCGLDHCKVIR